jgi:pyruvate/2-oxoglutarate dehydrogenase complex dihydrolipoamide dehydrogenase (E3) component
VKLHSELLFIGKISVDERECTNVPHIFAVGDVIEKGKLELTPVAIAAGRLLVRRLFEGSSKLMDYTNVPTTVFTPLEYGAVGLSEQEAKARYPGAKVYHGYFKPLEWNLNHDRGDTECYMKVIVDTEDEERVVGVHLLGPSAGEMVQGLAVAIKAGCTKAHLDDTIGEE